MEREKPKLGRNPEADASFLSRITFVYMLPVFWRGFRRQLVDEDLCEPLEAHRSQVATERLTKEWEKEKRLASEAGRSPSLVAAVRRIYFKPVALLGIILFVQVGADFLSLKYFCTTVFDYEEKIGPNSSGGSSKFDFFALIYFGSLCTLYCMYIFLRGKVARWWSSRFVCGKTWVRFPAATHYTTDSPFSGWYLTTS
ncbi:unnamed protein product [Toxocara canis]|uniref:XK-related protein n=1 Tax=Toxocara canis TaxID=6265 RepID=A0A183VB49_TOXCA|nr:unnamed protein product [Toxocara canis]